MMNDSLDPRDELTDRLRALGRQPVDPSLQSQHLTAMAGAGSGATFRGALASRLRMGTALVAGFLLGTTGLATAGVLGPLQPIAAKGVEAVTPLEVPKGKSAKAKAKAAERKADKAGDEAKTSRLADGSIGTLRYWDGCVPTDDGTFAGNRGLYLKQERAKSADAYKLAKSSDCGMPLSSLEDDADADADAKVEGDDDAKTAVDAGKPDDAGDPANRGASADKRPTTTPAKPARPNDRHADDRAGTKAANSSGHGQRGAAGDDSEE